MFVPYPTTPELGRPSHQDCNTAYHREVCLVDVKGKDYTMLVRI